jgi:hypothetical protein
LSAANLGDEIPAKSALDQASSSPDGWPPASETETAGGSSSAAKVRPDPRGWHIATAKIRDGIDELFDQGEDEERVRTLVLSQLRQVLDDRGQR